MAESNSTNIEDIILKYVIDQFGKSKDMETHYSYCSYPFEECCCRTIDKSTFTSDTELITGGFVDSFSTVSLLVFLEETFNIKIPDIEIHQFNFNTVNTMAALVKKYNGA